MRPLPAFLIALVSTLALAACSNDDGDAGAIVKVTASDDACALDSTALAAGNTTFRIQNDGQQVTEVYVYAEGDRVVTERENIGPGTSADLNADLAAGSYEVACKPGQTGDGIRQPITVTGEGGAAAPTESDVEVQVEAVDFSYTGLDALEVSAGETVAFTMRNTGTVEHELEVFGPDGEALGEIGPTAAGAEGTVLLTLDEPGIYRYVCGIDDHEAQGMAGTFAVS